MKATAKPLSSRSSSSLREAGGSQGRGARPVEQAERAHRRDHREHAHDAEGESERHLLQEGAARQPVTEARAVGEPQVAGQQHEPEQQRQHADARADAVEREVEVRVQQQPGRVGEDGDGGERQRHEQQEPTQGAHGLTYADQPPRRNRPQRRLTRQAVRATAASPSRGENADPARAAAGPRPARSGCAR